MGGGYASYRLWLCNRLSEMYRLLKPEGVLCVHLDYRSVHYIKTDLDKIFGQGLIDRGAKHLVNEIIWYFNQGGGPSSYFKNRHNTILVYSKGRKPFFNDKDVRLPFTPHKRSKSGRNYGGVMGIDKDGREYVEKWGTGKKKKYRYYLDEGKAPESVWTDIQSLQSGESERVDNRWSTQKPLALLDRLIKAFSKDDPKTVIADFFCGCGTTLSSAQGLSRRWLGVDVSKEASTVVRKRMARDHKLKLQVIPLKSLTKAQVLRLPHDEFERYAVQSIGGIPTQNSKPVDGYMPDGSPIEVKKHKGNIGIEVLDKFHKHLKANGRGYIIAKSFGKGFKNEVDRLKLEEGLDIVFMTVDELIRDVS